MEYQEFKEELKKELRKSFPDYFVEEHFEDRITIRVPECNMGATYRVKEIYKECQEVDRELMENLILHIQESLENMPEVDMEILNDFEKAKDKMFAVLIPAGTVRVNAVQEEFVDGIKCVARLLIGNGTCLCTEDMCKRWGVSAEEALEVAKNNIEGENAGTIEEITQKVRRLLPKDAEEWILAMVERLEPNERQYVVSTKRTQFGASAILQPGVQKELEKIFGSRFMLMPCSIHELIACKYIDKVEEYREMVINANLHDVKEEDFLSNSVLVYENGEFRGV